MYKRQVQTIVKGTKLTDKKGNTYKVTNVKKKEVTFVAQKKNAKGTLTIPATITAGTVSYTHLSVLKQKILQWIWQYMM